MQRWLWSSSLCLAVACGGGDGSPARPDAAASADAAVTADAAVADAASNFPLAGFGTLGGDCDQLDTELTDDAPSHFTGTMEFERGYTDADLDMLTEGAQRLLTVPNAGGSSELSEAFAFEVLARCEGAALLATEEEVEYDVYGAKTDFLAEIDGLPIGVSVTRAFGYPLGSPYSAEAAEGLVTDKLASIVESSANVGDDHRWEKQILAIMAYGPEEADTVAGILGDIDPAIRADTIVWITATGGDDGFIYCNGECPTAR